MDKDVEQWYSVLASGLAVQFDWSKDNVKIIKADMVGDTKIVGICVHKSNRYVFVKDRANEDFDVELHRFRS